MGASQGVGELAEVKSGAGLLLRCEDAVLLLLRNSRHNDDHWGLPGGNWEPGDAGAQETATREATEEVGLLPPLRVLSSHLTVRGKVCASLPQLFGQASKQPSCEASGRLWALARDEKEYTVYVCALEPAVRAAWTPVLNEEHRRWAWFPVDAVVAAAAGVSGAPAPLHPVVAALTAQHPKIFASGRGALAAT